MLIESCKFVQIYLNYYSLECKSCALFFRWGTVSHTVQDLVFIWNMTDPLVVNDDIELPQQDISKIYTTDCTIQYR